MAHQGMFQFGDHRVGEQVWLGHQPLWVSGWLEFGGGGLLSNVGAFQQSNTALQKMQLIDIKLLYISPDILSLLLCVEYVTHCLYYMEIEGSQGMGFLL